MPRSLLIAFLLLPTLAEARTLSVGPDQTFPSPSAAAHAAQDGDTVLIEPGKYYDCAIWSQNRLVIAGAQPGVVITDTTCQGKALFVITGNDITIRDLTLTRARVPDGNGAGIRQEGQSLTLQHVHFVNNQAGLIDGAAGTGAIDISDCTFEAGGTGGDRPTFAVLVDAVSLLHIERSSFKGNKGGQISTAAARTELTGNHIDTGTGDDPAVAVVGSNGHLVMQDNVLSIGPNMPRLAAAVLVTSQDAPELRHNRLQNATLHPAAMLLNWSGQNPLLEANQIEPNDTALSTTGLLRHRASDLYHGVKDEARGLAGQAKRKLSGMIGR